MYFWLRACENFCCACQYFVARSLKAAPIYRYVLPFAHSLRVLAALTTKFFASSVQSIRLDRFGDRLERVERRLEIGQPL